MPISAVLTAPGQITLEDRPKQEPAKGEVVIAVEHAGVCGTDLALFKGDYPVPLPLVCGHEYVGRVVQTGPGVSSEWENQRVVAEINNTCIARGRADLCRACRMGLPGHCQKRNVTGIIEKDGAFAEEVTVPAGVLLKVPDTLDPLLAVLTEPLAAALQTFEMTPVQGNETVAVLGPGRLGILIVFAARLKGLKVFAGSRSEAKRQRALRFGATEALPPDALLHRVREDTEDLGADIVIDATGTPDGITQAINMVRPRGVVSVKTTCGLPAGGLDMTKLVVDEILLQGSRCGPFAPALDILHAHQETLRPLITSQRPLSETQQALESAANEDKVVLDMPVLRQ